MKVVPHNVRVEPPPRREARRDRKCAEPDYGGRLERVVLRLFHSPCQVAGIGRKGSDQMLRRQQPYHFGANALMALARAEWMMVPLGPAGKLARTDARTFSRSLSDSAAIALPVGW